MRLPWKMKFFHEIARLSQLNVFCTDESTTWATQGWAVWMKPLILTEDRHEVIH